MKAKIKERIAIAIKESGLNMSEIARRLNVSPQAVRAWAVGISIPEREKLSALSVVCRKNEAWIQCIDDSATEKNIEQKNTVSIPVIDAKASAGYGIENFDSDQPLKLLEIDPIWLIKNTNVRDHSKLRIITISGDSMMPTLQDGEFALIDISFQSHLTDSIYLANVNGQLYIKRFQRRPDGALLMISDNKKYETFAITETDNLQILGRLCYHWSGERL